MKYYLDTEFNGFGGALMSLALVREDGRSLYVVMQPPYRMEEWVAENVAPIMDSVPEHIDIVRPKAEEALPWIIAHYLAGDDQPRIVTDWPDDVSHFCKAVITGPGEMAPIPHLTFEVARVDAYPTKLAGAVQHNAWWDAMALRYKLRDEAA